MAEIIDPFDKATSSDIVDPFEQSVQTSSNDDEQLRQKLKEMNWVERQLMGAGGVVAKGIQGIAQLVGAERDPRLERQAKIASEEAPIGAIAGEVLKYAPAVLASGIAVPAAIAGGLGALYNTTGDRLTAGALEGGMAALGGGVAKAATKLTGMGTLDRARNALRSILGDKTDDAIAALKAAQGQDIRSAQALADIPDAGRNIAALESMVRSGGKGVENAIDPIASANFYANQAARQEAARREVLERMAGGASAESSALRRDFLMKQAEAELGPKRAAILKELAAPGQQLDEILPMLGNTERRYVSALREGVAPQPRVKGVANTEVLPKFTPQGVANIHPSTEAAQSMVRNAEGAPGWISNADRAQEWQSAAGDFRNIASELRASADALRAQVAALPSAFTAAPVRNAVASRLADPRARMNTAQTTVLSAISDKLKIAGDDPAALAELMRVGVNELIGDLIQSGKVSKASASAALGEAKGLIKQQLGDKFVNTYLVPYSKKLANRDAMMLADDLRYLQQNQPDQFIKAVRGELPELTTKYATSARTMQEALGDKRFAQVSDIAKQLERDAAIKEAGKNLDAKAAIEVMLKKGSMAKYLPNMLDRYVVLMNTAIKEGAFRVDRSVYRELDKALRDPAAMVKLIERLPPEQRNIMNKMIFDFDRLGGGTVGGAALGGVAQQ